MTAPRVATRDNWPIDYLAVIKARAAHLQRMRANPKFRAACMMHYANNPADWMTDFMVTVDPRADLKIMPFIMFPRQIELVNEMHRCLKDQESLLVDKTREMGASWTVIGFFVWGFFFIPNANFGLGSRKEDLVDRLADPSTLFEKVRTIIRWLPRDIFWPEGFNEKDHMPYMRVLNPGNGATIIGEGGQNIGRGGRYLAYVVDEEAFLQNQEATDSALGDATRVRISISTYNAMNDLFHRRRKAGLDLPDVEKGRLRIFVLDWRDHPAKTIEWYNLRRAKAEAEGTLHLFAREVDRDPTASQSNVLIPGLWVSAAIDAHIKLGFEPEGSRIAAMDVADGGGDVNSLAIRHGVVLTHLESEGGEAGVIGRKYYVKSIGAKCQQWRFEVNGVGAGARTGAQQVAELNPGKKLPAIVAWSPSHGVKRPAACIHTGKVGADVERRNRDHYLNGNVQDWDALRKRFNKTYRAVTLGEQFDPDELISLDSRMPLLAKLQAELSQPIYGENSAGKMTVDKQPPGSKSPNLADAVKICFAELATRPDEPACGVGGVGPAAQGVFVAVG